MNTTKKLMLVFSIFTLITSCSKKTNDLSPEQTSEKLKQGTWKVSYYFDNGKDETYKFNGYTLTFGSNNLLEILNNSKSSYTGTWYYNNTSDDNSGSSDKLVINIMGDEIVNKLQNDWLIVEMTTDLLHLENDNIDKQEVLKISRSI